MLYIASMGVLAAIAVYHREMPTWAMVAMLATLYVCGLLDGATILKRKIRQHETPP